MRGPRWSQQDILRLHYHWGAPLTRLSTLLGRSPAAIAEKARKLGLRARWQAATTVARRIGIDRAALLSLCARHGIRLTRSPLRVRSAGHARRYVDFDAAVAAYEAEVDSETCYAAASRYGHDRAWVVRRLKAAGIWRRGWWVRYPAAQIDAAIAAYSPSAASRAGRSLPPHSPTSAPGPAGASSRGGAS